MLNRRQILTQNSHSRSFKVTYFGVTERLLLKRLRTYYSIIVVALYVTVWKIQRVKEANIAIFDHPTFI